MNEVDLKEWLRDNLIVTAEPSSYIGNSVYVGLKFKDEDQPFSAEYIVIPSTGGEE